MDRTGSGLRPIDVQWGLKTFFGIGINEREGREMVAALAVHNTHVVEWEAFYQYVRCDDFRSGMSPETGLEGWLDRWLPRCTRLRIAEKRASPYLHRCLSAKDCKTQELEEIETAWQLAARAKFDHTESNHSSTQDIKLDVYDIKDSLTLNGIEHDDQALARIMAHAASDIGELNYWQFANYAAAEALEDRRRSNQHFAWWPSLLSKQQSVQGQAAPTQNNNDQHLVPFRQRKKTGRKTFVEIKEELSDAQLDLFQSLYRKILQVTGEKFPSIKKHSMSPEQLNHGLASIGILEKPLRTEDAKQCIAVAHVDDAPRTDSINYKQFVECLASQDSETLSQTKWSEIWKPFQKLETRSYAERRSNSDNPGARLSVHQRKHYIKCFNQIDLNGTGSCTAKTLRQHLAELGVDLSPIEARTMVLVCDHNGNGGFEKDEFLALMATFYGSWDSSQPTPKWQLWWRVWLKRCREALAEAAAAAEGKQGKVRTSINPRETLGDVTLIAEAAKHFNSSSAKAQTDLCKPLDSIDPKIKKLLQEPTKRRVKNKKKSDNTQAIKQQAVIAHRETSDPTRAEIRLATRRIDKKLVAAYRQIFDAIDTDHSGCIDLRELYALTGSKKSEKAKRRARQLLAEYDSDRNGAIEFTEFLHLMADHPPDGLSQCKNDQERARLIGQGVTQWWSGFVKDGRKGSKNLKNGSSSEKATRESSSRKRDQSQHRMDKEANGPSRKSSEWLTQTERSDSCDSVFNEAGNLTKRNLHTKNGQSIGLKISTSSHNSKVSSSEAKLPSLTSLMPGGDVSRHSSNAIWKGTSYETGPGDAYESSHMQRKGTSNSNSDEVYSDDDYSDDSSEDDDEDSQSDYHAIIDTCRRYLQTNGAEIEDITGYKYEAGYTPGPPNCTQSEDANGDIQLNLEMHHEAKMVRDWLFLMALKKYERLLPCTVQTMFHDMQLFGWRKSRNEWISIVVNKLVSDGIIGGTATESGCIFEVYWPSTRVIPGAGNASVD